MPKAWPTMLTALAICTCACALGLALHTGQHLRQVTSHWTTRSTQLEQLQSTETRLLAAEAARDSLLQESEKRTSTPLAAVAREAFPEDSVEIRTETQSLTDGWKRITTDVSLSRMSVARVFMAVADIERTQPATRLTGLVLRASPAQPGLADIELQLTRLTHE